MRVFGLTTGADTAGINAAIASAFRRHTDWDVRAMVATQNYIGYPVDVPWSQRGLEELYDAADVIHLHNTLHGHRWYDNGQRKPTVLHHHGLSDGTAGTFRTDVKAAKRVGVVQVGSTLDLAILAPEDVTWLPAPANLPWLAAFRKPHEGKLRIGHAPTNRTIKGTHAFLAAMEGLRDVAEPVLVERRPWTECLATKGTCDVFFDQPVLGYGSNAIEAWAMGIPVISGIADPEIRAGMIDRWGQLPFLEASEATLETALRALAADAGLREEYSRRGTAHIRRWHDERVTAQTLIPIYEAAPRTVPGGRDKRLSPNQLARIRRHEQWLRRKLVTA